MRTGQDRSVLSSHSRGPVRCGAVAGRIARSARVTGAPSTSGIGASMLSSMCWLMCTLSRTGPYSPSPLDVATTTTSRPASQAMVRPSGQGAPRARSRRRPAR